MANTGKRKIVNKSKKVKRSQKKTKRVIRRGRNTWKGGGLLDFLKRSVSPRGTSSKPTDKPSETTLPTITKIVAESYVLKYTEKDQQPDNKPIIIYDKDSQITVNEEYFKSNTLPGFLPLVNIHIHLIDGTILLFEDFVRTYKLRQKLDHGETAKDYLEKIINKNPQLLEAAEVLPYDETSTQTSTPKSTLTSTPR